MRTTRIYIWLICVSIILSEFSLCPCLQRFTDTELEREIIVTLVFWCRKKGCTWVWETKQLQLRNNADNALRYTGIRRQYMKKLTTELLNCRSLIKNTTDTGTLLLHTAHLWITMTNTWNGIHVNINMPVIRHTVLDSLASLLALKPSCGRKASLCIMMQ